jgi:hypothetical protein
MDDARSPRIANADEPGTEIGVTAEMIEAASAVFEEHYLGDGRYALDAECIAKAYRAMIRSRAKLVFAVPQTHQ